MAGNSRAVLGNLTILHCIPSFGGGGAERQLCYLANTAAGLGMMTHVAYIHDGPNLNVLDRSRVVLHKMRAVGNYDPAVLLQLVRLIRKVRPRLVQTWITQMDVMGGLAALMTDTPFVLSERSSALAYPGGWKSRLRVRVGCRAVAVAANSEAGRRYWSEIGYRGRSRVIRNGIPIGEIERVQRAELSAWGVPNGNRVIVFAGRYSEEKNIVLMLKALERVVPKRKDVTALLFGEGPLRRELERQVNASGLAARIRVGGFSDSLLAVMKAADLFVSVSNFEGNPNTVLEAMAAKCPLVVSDIPEHREFLDESSAYFAAPSSVDEVTAAIERAMDNREEARAKAGAAYRIAGGRSVELQAREYMDLYMEILGDGIRQGHRHYG